MDGCGQVASKRTTLVGPKTRPVHEEAVFSGFIVRNFVKSVVFCKNVDCLWKRHGIVRNLEMSLVVVFLLQWRIGWLGWLTKSYSEVARFGLLVWKNCGWSSLRLWFSVSLFGFLFSQFMRVLCTFLIPEILRFGYLDTLADASLWRTLLHVCIILKSRLWYD
jgi:hypothetical protein